VKPSIELATWVVNRFTVNYHLLNVYRSRVLIEHGMACPHRHGTTIGVGYEWLIAKADNDPELKEILVRWEL